MNILEQILIAVANIHPWHSMVVVFPIAFTGGALLFLVLATATQPAATATSTATSIPTILPSATSAGTETAAGPTLAESVAVSFARDVQPIFNCVRVITDWATAGVANN